MDLVIDRFNKFAPLLNLSYKPLVLIFESINTLFVGHKLNFLREVVKLFNVDSISDKNLTMETSMACSDNKTSLCERKLSVVFIICIINWDILEIIFELLTYPSTILLYIFRPGIQIKLSSHGCIKYLSDLIFVH